jgi:hypothetical protein
VSKRIKLTQGKYTIVDADVYEWASNFKWHAANWKNGFYATRAPKMVNGYRGSKIALHREIMKAVPGQMVDHINGDTLDNRRVNLRICDNTQNQRNSRLGKNNTSGYKGAGWHKIHKKWVGRIKVNNKLIHLGYFNTVIEAAKAYDEAAIKYFGEFANINFKEDCGV